MTKQDVLKALEGWPADAEIEIAIPHDIDAEDPVIEDKIWLEIAMIEKPNPRDGNEHCLIFGGRVMME